MISWITEVNLILHLIIYWPDSLMASYEGSSSSKRKQITTLRQEQSLWKEKQKFTKEIWSKIIAKKKIKKKDFIIVMKTWKATILIF